MFVFYRLQILQFFRKFLIFPELFGDQKDWGSRGREFKSRHSDQLKLLKKMQLPESLALQGFQRFLRPKSRT